MTEKNKLISTSKVLNTGVLILEIQSCQDASMKYVYTSPFLFYLT